MSRHERRRGPSRPIPKKDASIIVEAATPAENPTTLTLFRFTPEELIQARLGRDRALQFRQDFILVKGVYERFTDAVDQRKTYLDDTCEAFRLVVDDYKSQVATANMFIIVDEGLEELGASPQERFEFFSQALAINIAADPAFSNYARAQQKHLTRNPLEYAKVFESPLAKRRGIDRIFAKMTANVPQWYTEDKKSWRVFVAKHALDEDYDPSSARKEFGIIKKHALPDWYTPADNQTPPRRETVMQERKNALTQWITVSLASDKAVDYYNVDLDNYTAGRFTAAASSVEQQKRDAFLSMQSVADVLQFLAMIDDDVNEYTVTASEQMLSMTNEQLHRHMLKPVQVREKAIREFAALQEADPTVDTLALFLERKLIDGDIIQSAKEPATDNHIGSFGLLIDAMDESMPLAEQFFLSLKDTYPKIFAALNDHVRPLLALMPNEERTELKDLISASKDTEIEEIIWLIAGCVVKHTEGAKQTLTPVRTFIADWLSKYWESEELHEQLGNALGEQTPSSNDQQTLIQTQIRALEEAINTVQQGNLAGWHIYQASQPTTDKRRLKEVEGQTLAERQEALGKLLQERGITQDMRLLIDFLDWAILLPQEVEGKQKRGKDRFKKIKLGEVEYQFFVDPLKQEIVFTL